MNELEQVAYSEKKIEKSPWLPDDRPTAPKVGSTMRECSAVIITLILLVLIRVADLDPNPDPHFFGPPGSGFGSIIQMYGSGFGSFYHQAKIARNTFIPTGLGLLFDLLSLKNVVNVPSKSNSRKTVF